MAHIEKRGPNSYRLRVPLPVEAEGDKRRFKSVTVRYPSTMTAKQQMRRAKQDLALLEQQVEQGVVTLGRAPTLEAFAYDWLQDKGAGLAEKTREHYRGLLARRILPALGHYRLDKLTPAVIQKFYRDMQQPGARLDKKKGQGLSGKSIHEHHAVLNGILEHAVDLELLPNNPASRVALPRKGTREAEHFSLEEVRTFMPFLDQQPLQLQALVHLALWGGLRRGEAVALEWGNVNFQSNQIEISQALSYVPGKGVLTKAPKTQSGRRVLSMPPQLMDILKALKAAQNETRLQAGDCWIQTDRLFTQDDGTCIHPDTVTKWWKGFLEGHGLPYKTFHALRHTNATLLIGNGQDPQTVSKRLGHSMVSTTLDIYTHAIEQNDRDAAGALAGMFDEVKKEAR